MEETKKAPQYNIISAVLFAVIAFFSIISAVSRVSHGMSAIRLVVYLLQTVTFIGGNAVLAVSLFQRRGDKLTLTGFLILAVSSLIALVSGLRYGIRSFLPDLLDLAGYAGALAIAASFFTDCFPQYREKAKKLWFVPAVCIAGQIVIGFFVWIVAMIVGGMYHVGFWRSIFSAAAILFACMWIAYPEGMPKKQYALNADNSAPTVTVSEEDGYFELAAHVLLLIFTFGIWHYIWIYRMTKYLNCLNDEPPRNPTTKLLLCLFVPFYYIYWTYKSAQRIDRLAQTKGIPSDFATLCLILAIFVTIVPPILMQEKVNTIIKGKTAPVSPPSQSAEPQEAHQVDNGVPEELKKYKELLDSGIITQEEFDQKKEQLLNL